MALTRGKAADAELTRGPDSLDLVPGSFAKCRSGSLCLGEAALLSSSRCVLYTLFVTPSHVSVSVGGLRYVHAHSSCITKAEAQGGGVCPQIIHSEGAESGLPSSLDKVMRGTVGLNPSRS